VIYLKQKEDITIVQQNNMNMNNFDIEYELTAAKAACRYSDDAVTPHTKRTLLILNNYEMDIYFFNINKLLCSPSRV